MDFELLLKYDKKIEEINNVLKKLKEKRSQLEEELIEKYKNHNEPIKVNNLLISCNNVETLPPLSMKLLSSLFNQLFDNNNKEKLLNVINTYRNNNKKSCLVLKRKLIKNRSHKRKKKTLSH